MARGCAFVCTKIRVKQFLYHTNNLSKKVQNQEVMFAETKQEEGSSATPQLHRCNNPSIKFYLLLQDHESSKALQEGLEGGLHYAHLMDNFNFNNVDVDVFFCGLCSQRQSLSRHNCSSSPPRPAHLLPTMPYPADLQIRPEGHQRSRRTPWWPARVVVDLNEQPLLWSLGVHASSSSPWASCLIHRPTRTMTGASMVSCQTTGRGDTAHRRCGSNARRLGDVVARLWMHTMDGLQPRSRRRQSRGSRRRWQTRRWSTSAS